MIKKLIIHIGYPKTATSSMQLNLFTNLMHDNKIEYLNHLDKGDKNLGNFSVKNILNNIVLGVDKKTSYLSEMEELTKIRNTTTVLSSESISHVCPNSLKALSKIAAIENAETLYKIFSPYFDVIEILMTIRSQKTIIPSYYTQEYYNIVNDETKFKDIGVWFNGSFCENILSENLIFNYDSMHTAYANFFGEKNIHVLVYEDLLYDKIKYYKKIAFVLDIELNIVEKYFEAKALNKTTKLATAETKTDNESIGSFLKTNFNRLFQNHKDSSWFIIIKSGLKVFLPKKVLNIKLWKSASIRPLNKEELTFIDKRFRLSNKCLAEKGVVDIDKLLKYGYLIN